MSRTDASKPARRTPAERPDKSKIAGLPAQAQIQWQGRRWYVYYAYRYNKDGKTVYERDYIGTVSEDGTRFEPNLRFIQSGRYERSQRPPENWKDPERRQMARQKLQEKGNIRPSGRTASAEREADQTQDASAGATALCAAILKDSGWDQTLYSLLGRDAEKTRHALNLAIRAVLASDANLSPKSRLRPQEEVFLKEIGANAELARRFAKARSAHLEGGALLAVEGRLEEHVPMSLVVDAGSGEIVFYRGAVGGGKRDVVQILQALPDLPGLRPGQVLLVSDLGAPSASVLEALKKKGFAFLFDARDDEAVQSIIDNESASFIDLRNYLRTTHCCGRKFSHEASESPCGVALNTYVFRAGFLQEQTFDALLDRLDAFKAQWAQASCGQKEKLRRDALFRFCRENTPCGTIEEDMDVVSETSRAKGFFALTGSADMEPLEVCRAYWRKEALLSCFVAIYKHIAAGRRVLSAQEANAGLLIASVGTSVLSNLASRLQKVQPHEAAFEVLERLQSLEAAPDIWGFGAARALLRDLGRIRLAAGDDGEPILAGVCYGDCAMAHALGFSGLFDEAQGVLSLLSGERFAQ